MQHKRAYIFLLPVLCLLAVASGCSKAPDQRANVMFVNGCAGSNKIYAWANKTKVIGAVNIDYTKSSNYQKLASGRFGVNFYYSSNADSLCGGSLLFNVGDHYTLYAGGTTTAPTFVVTTDDLTPPAAGNARIRFINLTNDVTTEDFTVGSQTVVTGLTNGTCSSFYDVTAGTYLVKATGPWTWADSVSDSMRLEAGVLYTAMLTGSQSASTGSTVLTLSLIANR